ncbi:hypothetical protein GCM10009813_19490 [Brevibacterium marinum]|uniref:HNH endonuclease n=1 Tax=Brevibacterium marinum TaxID=418643 RepID=A0A846RXA6_9MICO|nr:hypothetical protein [Brevibacterium marinum]
MKHPSDSDSTASEPARDSQGTSSSAGSESDRSAVSEESRRSHAAGDASAEVSDGGPSAPGDRSKSARRLHIDADSPFAEAAEVFAASDRAQLSALDVSAELFFNEVVENLNLFNPTPGRPYAHVGIADTVRRYQQSACTSGAKTTETTPEKAAERAPEEPKDERNRLSNFPRFRLDQTFYGWVHDLSQAEDIAEFTTILGTTTARAYTQITSAMTLIHGLPKFHARCLAGEFTIEHVNAAAHACRDVKFKNLPSVDDYLADRRADITLETFKKSLGMKIAVLEPLEERVEEASKRRRVDITTGDDGTACLTLTGPAPELQACYIRIAAFARAIRSGNVAPFSDQVKPGISIDDNRGIDALMFDILTRTCPQLNIRVTSNNTTTGETETREIPLDVPTDASLAPADVVNAVKEGIANASADAEEDDDGLEAEVVLRMPTHGQWLESQAKMITTVPFLTLAGESDLPGVFSDGSPIPADTARRIAGHSKSWSRILTDPATGTPVDAKATTYQIPISVRQTLIAKWQTCTIPGCTRRSENTEIDHLIPFDHDRPGSGGLTQFNNLHCLCKLHHQAKTDRKYSVRMSHTGVLEYVFRHGITTESAPGDHPINAAHAKLFDAMRQREAEPSDPPESDDRFRGDPSRNARSPNTSTQGTRSPNAPRLDSPPQDGASHGDIRISEERPGPEAAAGRPGWVKNDPMISAFASKNEWIWDSGGPPPF